MNVSAYRMGAWCWVLTGVGHLALDSLKRFRSDSENPVAHQLRVLPFEILGMKTNYQDLITGFSLLMGTAILMVGISLLLLCRDNQENPRRSAVFVGAVGSMVASVISLAYIKLLPPIILFSVAAIAFIVALLAQKTQVSTQEEDRK